MRPKHRSCRPSSRALVSEGGFVLAEALAALLSALVVLVTVSTVLLAYMQRARTDQAAAQIESQGSAMAASITQDTKTASLWAIYADRNTFLADPVKNVASQGNVLVCNTTTRAGPQIVVSFEYDPAAGTLVRSENTFATATNKLSKAAPPAGFSTVFDQNLGLLRGHWTLAIPNELVDFEAYGTPPHIR